MTATPMSRLMPLTLCRLVFVPLASVALNLLAPRLPWLPQPTTLDHVGTWLSGVAREDSCKPMRPARSWAVLYPLRGAVGRAT